MALHTSIRDDLRAAAGARVTLAATAALLALLAVVRLASLPGILTVVAWPALAGAFLLDTALYNGAGIRVGDAGFWTLFVGCCYLESVAFVALARGVRGTRAERESGP
ncbi:hypothetical protein [Halobaculum sp. EA56]|uniref:hypothetical protein n=1 Tax=Halobaculum sp. EA56 TaxID=3421648 RepID=UPI003EBFBA21